MQFQFFTGMERKVFFSELSLLGLNLPKFIPNIGQEINTVWCQIYGFS